MYSIVSAAVISKGVRAHPFALIALLLASGFAAPIRAQDEFESGRGDRDRPVTLREAEIEALSRNVDMVIATEQERMAVADASRARSFLWPEVDLGSGVVRSTDPVFAFGTKLRQARFAESDFGLNDLNNPDPIEDWTTQADLRWRVLSPARWMTLFAASEAARSAEWSTVRMRDVTLLQVRQLYFQAARAAAHSSAARAAEEAASANAERFRKRRSRGLLTRADQLQAEAELATASAARIDSERVERDARQELGSFLGWPPELLPLPIDTLAAPTDRTTTPFDANERPDVRSLEAAWRAARAERRRAGLDFVPAIDAFGTVASHSDHALDSDSTDWSVGVVLRWPVFTGFRRSAELDRARGAERIARERYEQVRRDARVEVDQALRAVIAAESRFEAAIAARRAEEEATELMRRRFEEGLATPSDMLLSEARLSMARSRAIDSLADYQIAVARTEFVRSQVDSVEVR